MSARRGAKRSHGLLMYRRVEGDQLEVFIAHPGGPYFKNKDDGVWTIPKGEANEAEEPLACAKREFEEETGLAPGPGPFLPLGEIKQRGGKLVHAWAFEGRWDDRTLCCNSVEIEWPPRSGKMLLFPEVDRVAFVSVDVARRKLNPAQVELLDRLLATLASLAGAQSPEPLPGD
jgi:predicted NUDIX family NTP pyrophosphohydrolase